MLKKTLIASFLLSGFYFGSARAQPAPPPQPVKLQLTVTTGADSRTHDIEISDRGCGVVKEKSKAYEDEFSICSTPSTNGVSLAVESMIRAGMTEYRLRVELAVPRKGGTASVGRTNNSFRYALKTL